MNNTSTNLRILQNNAQRCISATSLISNQLTKYDLVLLQEPYCRAGTPACLPTFCSILSEAFQDPWAITLVPNTNFTVMHHAKHSNENIVATEINLNDKRIVILNIYFSGGADSESYLKNLQDTIDAFSGTYLIIVGDINAHSPAWGGAELDRCGDLFEEFLHRNNLLLLNNLMSPPTFQSTRRHSWIDVSTCSSGFCNRILNWRVLPKKSLSDHAHITFDICPKMRHFIENTPRRKYDPKRANWARIKEFLETNLIKDYSSEQN
ncbi:uncharacterized protein [Centruroides vittatus]|uniref:uncharacterized protein n=1 Tax=Centruroides vittatus TaxID=120091 RepID=UPI00350F1FDB